MELVLVIAVVGILAVVAVPNFFGVTQSFQEKADERVAAHLGQRAELTAMGGGFSALSAGAEKVLVPADLNETAFPNSQQDPKTAYTVKVKKSENAPYTYTVKVYVKKGRAPLYTGTAQEN